MERTSGNILVFGTTAKGIRKHLSSHTADKLRRMPRQRVAQISHPIHFGPVHQIAGSLIGIPSSSVRHVPIRVEGFTNGKPIGSMVLWKLARGSTDRPSPFGDAQDGR
jgi:hypothetical protein